MLIYMPLHTVLTENLGLSPCRLSLGSNWFARRAWNDPRPHRAKHARLSLARVIVAGRRKGKGYAYSICGRPKRDGGECQAMGLYPGGPCQYHGGAGVLAKLGFPIKQTTWRRPTVRSRRNPESK